MGLEYLGSGVGVHLSTEWLGATESLIAREGTEREQSGTRERSERDQSGDREPMASYCG